MNLKYALDKIDIIDERIFSAYNKLRLKTLDSDAMKEAIWQSSPQQIYETIEDALELMDQALVRVDMLRNRLNEGE
jgi:hypothetical protein